MNRDYFDSTEPLNISNSGILPHWNQRGKIQYVTFRLSDSLPQEKITELNNLRARFIKEHPGDWDDETKKSYGRIISKYEERLLDNGYGSCILKKPCVRKLVSDCIRFWDGRRYDILAYVIMPNHVHILIRVYPEEFLNDIMHSIKSYTSQYINRQLGNKGSVWMKEYFDRIIRSRAHLENCINYIVSNPRFLRYGEYEVYVNCK